MGNKSCYSNIRRRMRNNNTSNFINLTNPQQRSSPMSQYHICHDKTPEHRYEIASVDIKQKHLIDLFLLPYYNIEILSDDLNNEQECGICFEPFYQKNIVARLECLCIYHKQCLDEWGQRKRCCPLHMDKITLTTSIQVMQEEKQQETNFYISN
jgi:E3 ubiquitin-protein ligase ZNRF1/2